jgi:hypothetical protein
MSLATQARAGRLAAAVALACVLAPAHSRAQVRQWHALPVAGGTDALLATAHLEPGLPGWRVLYEAARRRHGLWGEEARPSAGRAPAGRPGGSVVALPLAPATWRRVLGAASLPDDQLARAILADRRASLLYRGLAALDEPTLAALAAEPGALSRIRRQSADVLAVFGARFRVRAGRVDVPGGAESAPPWEALVGESTQAPARFLVALLAADGGRRAFLYDSVARLDPQGQRFALGLGLPDGPGRALPALAAVFEREGAWWRRERGAFARPDADAARLLREARLRKDGTLAAPSALAFWEAVFDERAPSERAVWRAEVRRSPAVGAAWLAERVTRGGAAARRLRLEQLTLGQRVFGEAGEDALPDVLLAVQGLRDARSMVLTLERMGTRDPALYAAGVRAARRGGVLLQGALAVVARARFAGTLDVGTAERLSRSLFETAVGEKAASPRVLAGWVERALLPELGRLVGGGARPGERDATVLAAMAGVRPGGSPAPSEWEGLWYRADPAAAELARLEGVRRRQRGASLEEALGACQAPARDASDPCAATLPATLASLVYAAHLGDPEGPALAGEDLSRRHDFGPDPWALPEEVAGPGVRWHVRGSLLGLETALARLSLHALAGDDLPDAPPVIDPVSRRVLAVPVALANPRELSDAGQDAIAAAVEAGRRRAASLQAGDPDLDAACREAGLEPWRARAFEWLVQHEPAARGSFFSLGELLCLGAPCRGRWDGWGVADDVAHGLRLAAPGPRALDEGAGRRPDAPLEEGFVDLPLRAAAHLAERRLPARLGPALVATLLPSLLAEARPVAPDDRLGLDAWVRGLSPDRLDDAVASLVGTGPLLPASAPRGAR